MRKAALAVCAVVLSATAIHGQEPWANKLFRGTIVHDFGNVPRGAKLNFPFKMKNIYDVPLEITSTRVSCGCVTLTPSSRTLQPFEEGQLDVVMDASRFTGPKSVSLYVTVGPQYVSTAVLQVSAVSRADIVYNPGQVMFGPVARGQSPKQSIEVEYAGVLDWRVQSIADHPAPLDITFSEMYRRPGQVGYRVEVTVKPDAPPGAIKEEIFLRTNDPASPLVPVLVEGLVQAPLSVAPETVSLNTFRVGEVVKGRVRVRGSQAFRIVSIEGLGEGVSTTLPQNAALSHILTISYQAAKPGEVRRQLKIKTDLPQEAPVAVTLEGTAEP